MEENFKAKVKISEGFTINMGNYESARVDIGVEIEGKRDNMDELWEEAKNEVEEELSKQKKALEKQKETEPEF